MKEKTKKHNKKSGDGLSEAIKGVKDETKERRSGKFEEAASVLPPRLWSWSCRCASLHMRSVSLLAWGVL